MPKGQGKGSIKTRFTGKGLGTNRTQKPVAAILPPQVDEIVRSIPDRSEFIRQAIIEKLEREGLLPKAS